MEQTQGLEGDSDVILHLNFLNQYECRIENGCARARPDITYRPVVMLIKMLLDPWLTVNKYTSLRKRWTIVVRVFQCYNWTRVRHQKVIVAGLVELCTSASRTCLLEHASECFLERPRNIISHLCAEKAHPSVPILITRRAGETHMWSRKPPT